METVAPHAGAWIETGLFIFFGLLEGLSHPTRVRGLKLLHALRPISTREVAPHAGAWIETALYTTSALMD